MPESFFLLDLSRTDEKLYIYFIFFFFSQNQNYRLESPPNATFTLFEKRTKTTVRDRARARGLYAEKFYIGMLAVRVRFFPSKILWDERLRFKSEVGGGVDGGVGWPTTCLT